MVSSQAACECVVCSTLQCQLLQSLRCGCVWVLSGIGKQSRVCRRSAQHFSQQKSRRGPTQSHLFYLRPQGSFEEVGGSTPDRLRSGCGVLVVVAFKDRPATSLVLHVWRTSTGRLILMVVLCPACALMTLYCWVNIVPCLIRDLGQSRDLSCCKALCTFAVVPLLGSVQ